MERLVLALDIGTTNAKAQRFDSRGRAVGGAVKARVPSEPDGTTEPELLARAVEELFDAALALPAAPPSAVALTCAWHGLVGLDEAGNPVTRMSSWLDRRGGQEALLLRQRVSDAEDLRRRTGAPLHPSLPPARLFWLARHRPEAFARVARWCSLGEYLEVRWFGQEAGSPVSLASGSGLFDQFARQWDAELVELLGLRAGALAPVEEIEPGGDGPKHAAASGGGRLGLPLLPVYARRWPGLAEVPWLPAIGDGAAALVGSGCGSPGPPPHRVALTIGTSAAVRVLVPWEVRASRSLPPALFGYLLDARRAVVGAARSNAGSLIRWAIRVLNLPLEGDLVVLATRGRVPGGHGLLAVSSLAGERSPNWPVAARGSLSNLRLETSSLDILQALLEEAVSGLATGADVLEEWAGPLQLVLSGGGARSAGWSHLLADVTGRPVIVSEVAEASLRGAALVALERLGWRDEPVEVPDGETVEPDRERAELFRRLRA